MQVNRWVKKSGDAGRSPDGTAARVGLGTERIVFASAEDAMRYRVLAARQHHLEGLLAAVEYEMEVVLLRATWSLAAVMEHDG